MNNEQPVERVAVCGIGQMGTAAAVCFSRAGFGVKLWARDAAKLERLPAEIEQLNRFLDQYVGAANVEPGPIERTNEIAVVADNADLILECIAEDPDQKAALFRQFAAAANRGAIVASCTSGLPITDLGQRSGVGRRLVGAHFWNPPHLMPVVEVVRGDDTEAGVAESLSAALVRAGKIPVVCKDVPGFVGNRLLHALFREAAYMVQEGICSAEDCDRVARLTFGLRLPAVGPCENMDLVGLDLVAQIQSYLLADLSAANRPLPIVERLRAADTCGMRDGKGFHDWTSRDPTALLEQRDRQIVRQLAFLRDFGRLA